MKTTSQNDVTTVYILIHVHKFPEIDAEDVKGLGIYYPYEDALKAIKYLKTQPGFCDHLDDFIIQSYEINRTYWPDKFVHSIRE